MVHGILNVYKEKGYTSHDVVAKLRGIIGQKKIGHTGTLDPDAEGVLPVCLGKATRLCDLLTEKEKTSPWQDHGHPGYHRGNPGCLGHGASYGRRGAPGGPFFSGDLSPGAAHVFGAQSKREKAL